MEEFLVPFPRGFVHLKLILIKSHFIINENVIKVVQAFLVTKSKY